MTRYFQSLIGPNPPLDNDYGNCDQYASCLFNLPWYLISRKVKLVAISGALDLTSLRQTILSVTGASGWQRNGNKITKTTYFGTMINSRRKYSKQRKANKKTPLHTKNKTKCAKQFFTLGKLEICRFVSLTYRNFFFLFSPQYCTIYIPRHQSVIICQKREFPWWMRPPVPGSARKPTRSVDNGREGAFLTCCSCIIPVLIRAFARNVWQTCRSAPPSRGGHRPCIASHIHSWTDAGVARAMYSTMSTPRGIVR